MTLTDQFTAINDEADLITQTITALASKAGHAISTYGPEVVDYASGYLHMMAIVHLIQYGSGLIACAVFTWLLVGLNQNIWHRDWDNDTKTMTTFALLLFLGFPLLIAVISCCSGLFTDQELLGLFAPKIAVINYVVTSLPGPH